MGVKGRDVSHSVRLFQSQMKHQFMLLRGNNLSLCQMLSINAEPTSLQATERKEKNCNQKALEQSKDMFIRAQLRLEATLLKMVFLKAYAEGQL